MGTVENLSATGEGSLPLWRRVGPQTLFSVPVG